MKNKYELCSRLWPVLYLNGRAACGRPFDVLVITADGKGNEPMYSFTREYGFFESNCFPNQFEQVEASNAWNTRSP